MIAVHHQSAFRRCMLALMFLAGTCTAAGCRSEVDTMLAESHQHKLAGDWKQLDFKLRRINDRHPQHVEAWIFRHWNLSYNLIHEGTSADERYAYVQDAVDVLLAGLKANPESQKLFWHLGWLLGHKIGGDRDPTFPEKFAADEYLHQNLSEFIDVEQGLGHDEKPNHWLVARLMFLKAIEAQKQHPGEDPAQSPLILYSEPAMARIQHARELDVRGECGDVSLAAWKTAEEEWLAFASTEVPRTGGTVRLGDYDGGEDEEQKLLASYRAIVNFDAVLQQCQAEQRSDVRLARQFMYDARRALANQAQGRSTSDQLRPKEAYERALSQWASVFASQPPLAEHLEISEDVYLFYKGYRQVVLRGAPLPDDFPLREITARWEVNLEPAKTANAAADVP